jgi:ATP-binding cassette subfamily G (WHITE) protein 2 (SNQ2)
LKFACPIVSPHANRHNRAEFMLDVIGTGATAISTAEWHNVWKKSPEATATAHEVQWIHDGGRSRPAVETKRHTSLIRRSCVVARCGAAAICRDPTYVTAKFILNVAGGLFVGFIFWKCPSTEQDIQNKLFSIFTVTISTVPGAQQLQISFIANRMTYEIRERPSKIYSWSVWVTSQILVELPWNMSSGIPLFFSWYWTVWHPAERAGFAFLVFHGLDPVLLRNRWTGDFSYVSDE